MIGMGRLGGGELSYASDIDVLFVYDGDRAADFDAAERVAEQLVTEIGATTSEGQTFRIDARLRPEGNQGPLARSLGGYATYYERWGLTWERQALSKARVVAGDAQLGEKFCALVDDVVYGQPFTEDDMREIRRIKARIERERIPPGEDPQFHLKLGRGSLSRHRVPRPAPPAAARRRPARAAGSRHDRRAPAAAPRRPARPTTTPTRSKPRTASANGRATRRYLQSGSPSDALPSDRAEIEKLGLLLGYVHQPATSFRDEYRRLTRRARRVVEREFYGTR